MTHKTTPRIALVDGDVICYQLAFKNKDWPVEYCLADTEDFVGDILERSGANAYQMFLSGSTNFRDRVAISRPYKGTRVSEKPPHYQAVKDLLIEEFDAVVAEDCEADDLMAIEQTKWAEQDRETETIICTVDKDLLMVPGLHYSWRNDRGVVYVTEEEGNKFFFTQWLTGDPVDNIPGAAGIGIKTAQKLLADCKTLDEHFEAVVEAYKAKGHSEEYADEQAQLIWMRRHNQTSYQELKEK